MKEVQSKKIIIIKRPTNKNFNFLPISSARKTVNVQKKTNSLFQCWMVLRATLDEGPRSRDK